MAIQYIKEIGDKRSHGKSATEGDCVKTIAPVYYRPTDSSPDSDVVAIQSIVGAIKDGGSLTEAASVNVPNNSVSTLHIATAKSALTLNVNLNSGEVPNFAIEVDAQASVTAVTVTKTVARGSAVTLKYADAAGTALESGKYYQITCVGGCWTLAEFKSA